MATLPRLVAPDLPPIGGTIRATPEDFEVEEVPLYLPSGEGEHALFEIEKRGMNTSDALRRLSRALGAAPRDLGVAGQKDRNALTRQWMSARGVALDRVLAFAEPGLRVLRGGRHRNKLRLGHLRGNRFRIRVRNASGGALAVAAEGLARISGRGLPNGFGPQRFGTRGDNDEIGRLILAGDAAAVLEAIVGRPLPGDDARTAEARRRFREGDPGAASALMSPRHAAERHLLLALVKTGDPGHAVRTLPPRDGAIYLSAWQSRVFNRCLERRGERIGELLEGDLAMKHENGAVFRVTDAAAEQPRADRLEVSPTGPLFGATMLAPEGVEAEIEAAILGGEALPPGLPAALVPKGAMPGERRSFRVPVAGARAIAEDAALVLEFTLGKGVFATQLLHELGIPADPRVAPAGPPDSEEAS